MKQPPEVPAAPPMPAEAAGQAHASAHGAAALTARSSIRAIATEVGLARNTVRRYLHSAQIPDWRSDRIRRRRRLDPYRDEILARWNVGCHNRRQRFRDIRVQGYRGGVSHVGVFIARLREQLPHVPAPRADAQGASSQALRWVLVRRPDQLDQEEAAQVQALLKAQATVATLYGLVQCFGQMVRSRHADDLDAWLSSAAGCGITEIQSVAQGVRRDHAAVAVGLTVEWSQGQMESRTSGGPNYEAKVAQASNVRSSEF